jgi:hypothetical protein
MNDEELRGVAARYGLPLGEVEIGDLAPARRAMRALARIVASFHAATAAEPATRFVPEVDADD